ncbi:MAG: hypothetical protein PHD48_12305 [Alphaproteobacteria bacterium]|nr:hypothetical protein [Alphaproteobacteria bacterium]
MFKKNQINDGRNRNLDPVTFRLDPPRPAVRLVKDVQPHISEAGKNLKDLLSAPELAAHKKSAFVQVFGNFLHTDTRRVFAVDVECKDFPNNLGLGWINIQFLFQPPMCASSSRINCPIAKGSFSPVKISLPRIFIHAAQGVLGVFFALVFIKHHDQMAEKLPHRIVARFLCNRNKINPRLIQPTFIENSLRQITEETRIAMDNDCLKRSVFFHPCRNHFLKLRPLVIRRACASLYIFMGDDMPVALAPFTHLAQLVGNG